MLKAEREAFQVDQSYINYRIKNKNRNNTRLVHTESIIQDRMKIQYLAFLYGFLSSPVLSIFGAPAYFAKRKYRLINSVQINFSNIASR